MSKFLAVDTSSRYLTVVAVNGERWSIKYLEDCAMQHSVRLMGEIEAALAEAQLAPADCDFFVAVTGPGSFTGIRIGISCIKGMATALVKPAAGVTAFDLISYNVNSDCDFAVVIDAGHGYYYVCGYAPDGSKNIDPCYLSQEEVEGLGRVLYGHENLPLGNYYKLDASACLYHAAIKCDKASPLEALYVRKSQAEEERERKLSAQ